MKLKALFNAVIVEPITGEQQKGNIYIPDIDGQTNPKGTVVSVGPGTYTLMGEFHPTTIKVGDKVILPTMGFTKLKHDNKEYLIGPENQILSLIEE